MNKNDVLKVLDLSGIIAAAVATVLVLVSEFMGLSLLFFYALVLYTATFLIASVFFGIRTHDIFKKSSSKSNETEQSQESQVQIVDELSQTKSKKIGVIVKLVLSLVAFIFTLTVLVLY